MSLLKRIDDLEKKLMSRIPITIHVHIMTSKEARLPDEKIASMYPYSRVIIVRARGLVEPERS